MMQGPNAVLGGVLLLAAGLFQISPLKHACLTHCRSRLGFMTTEWWDRSQGALSMGFSHGVYCVGCCWVLMALFYVTDVMNLVWIALIAAFVLLEKVAPSGQWAAWIAAPILIALAIWSFASI